MPGGAICPVVSKVWFGGYGWPPLGAEGAFDPIVGKGRDCGTIAPLIDDVAGCPVEIGAIE